MDNNFSHQCQTLSTYRLPCGFWWTGSSQISFGQLCWGMTRHHSTCITLNMKALGDKDENTLPRSFCHRCQEWGFPWPCPGLAPTTRFQGSWWTLQYAFFRGWLFYKLGDMSGQSDNKLKFLTLLYRGRNFVVTDWTVMLILQNYVNYVRNYVDSKNKRMDRSYAQKFWLCVLM